MAEPADPAIVVRVGSDRFGRERRVFGLMPFIVKVTSADSGGGLLVLEQSNAHLGGPPRHAHERAATRGFAPGRQPMTIRTT